MARELLILRHAKSDWDAGASSDFARPLAKRGNKDAPLVGEWLYREGLVPDFVVSSPAERARQTVLKVCKSLDFKKKKITWDDGIYEGGLSDLLRILRRCPADVSTVLLVGHNPGLEDLVRYLAGDEVQEPVDGKLLPTAALARLEMPEDWRELVPGCGQLVAITRPRKLSS
ncbi:MAG: histidine phosphatase family protein [Pseudomonadota bacterium]|nr:histidine phosphatase family protein [Pseudomonadota bacterium]